MFSRIYKSARALIYTSEPNTTKDQPPIDEIMVTPRTRREPLEEDLDDNNSISVYVPTPKSSKRRKRTEVEDSDMDDEEQVVTPSPKKRKVLPVQAKDGEEERPSSSTRPVVEIPAVIPSPEAETPVSTKTKHRRFDSEEPAEEFFSTAPEKSTQDNWENQEVADEEEIDDSEDDAPEAIGMQEAAETIRSREKDTAKAVKEQVNATKQKRKERDEALRKQSESAKKRKSKTKTKEFIEIDSEVDKEDSDAAHNGMVTKENVIRPTKILNSRSLPDLLPLEFLKDDDPEEVLAIEEAPKKASKNKRKFRDLLEKVPKDRKIGGTTYRVSKAQSTNLAPKAALNARSVKESWLQGRSGKKVDPYRKPISKGFFKK
ncbi:uncharacterized protein PAC_11514 [Phialocephala subalpina]|uniref:Uncharacterized protein n=1 Tax=Phialocephala subalpina TaxID=576137 RepID=A0A1L7X9G3_9HELO|nr:uncharacterized protein PAC_11514 [Phialocephala subalpina]